MPTGFALEPVAHPHRPPIDYDTLAEFLAALGYPTRLELLDQLRFPRTLGEIELSPRRHASGQSPDRPASRQAVLKHLNKLQAADLVRTQDVVQQGRTVPRYEANPVRLYALMEDLRAIVVRYAGRGLGPDATATIGSHQAAEPVQGPRLVLVRGVYEGKAFALADEPGRRWTIGRAASADVCLDYDPYVSTENTVIEHERRRFVLHDLGSKNGTAVNWELLEPEAERELLPGDVVGVGRSLLSFVPG